MGIGVLPVSIGDMISAGVSVLAFGMLLYGTILLTTPDPAESRKIEGIAMAARILLLCGAVGAGLPLLAALVPGVWRLILLLALLANLGGGLGVMLHVKCLETILQQLGEPRLADRSRYTMWGLGCAYLMNVTALGFLVMTGVGLGWVAFGGFLAGLVLLFFGGMYIQLLVRTKWAIENQARL